MDGVALLEMAMRLAPGFGHCEERGNEAIQDNPMPTLFDPITIGAGYTDYPALADAPLLRATA